MVNVRCPPLAAWSVNVRSRNFGGSNRCQVLQFQSSPCRVYSPSYFEAIEAFQAAVLGILGLRWWHVQNYLCRRTTISNSMEYVIIQR